MATTRAAFLTAGDNHQTCALFAVCRILQINACNLARSVLAYIVTDWSQIKFLYNLFFAFVHATLGSYPQVIHIGRTDESSTGDYRVIHNLSTGYPQVIYRLINSKNWLFHDVPREFRRLAGSVENFL